MEQGVTPEAGLPLAVMPEVEPVRESLDDDKDSNLYALFEITPPSDADFPLDVHGGTGEPLPAAEPAAAPEHEGILQASDHQQPLAATHIQAVHRVGSMAIPTPTPPNLPAGLTASYTPLQEQLQAHM